MSQVALAGHWVHSSVSWVGGGDSGTECLTTAKQSCRAEAVNAKI